MRAIPHRPRDQTPALRAAGDDLFSCARAALARRGSGGAAGSSPPQGRHELLGQGATQGILAWCDSLAPIPRVAGWPLGQRARSSWANISIPGSSWWRGAGNQNSILVAQELERRGRWGGWGRGLGAAASILCWWVEGVTLKVTRCRGPAGSGEAAGKRVLGCS